MRRIVRGSELLGCRVWTAGTGRRLGMVRDLVLDPAALRVTGLVLDPGGWWHRPRVVPWTAVLAVGDGALLVRDVPDGEGPDGPRWSQLAAKPALSGNGDELGVLADLWLDAGGVITGVQLSGGLWDDLISGQPVWPVGGGLRIGADAVFFS